MGEELPHIFADGRFVKIEMKFHRFNLFVFLLYYIEAQEGSILIVSCKSRQSSDQAWVRLGLDCFEPRPISNNNSYFFYQNHIVYKYLLIGERESKIFSAVTSLLLCKQKMAPKSFNNFKKLYLMNSEKIKILWQKLMIEILL